MQGLGVQAYYYLSSTTTIYVTNISSDREAIRPSGLETCEYRSFTPPL